MANKKNTHHRPASKISSAKTLNAADATVTGNTSSVLRAAFSPSEFQLALFASVIQGLDAQHLRIHDVETGALQCEHAVAPKESITSLDWGYYHGGHSHREQRKNNSRKKTANVNGDVDERGNVVVAFGTSSSEIRMYSPAEDKVVATLSGAHEGGIKDFKFTAGRTSGQGWSIGGDKKLVQWDLRTGQSIRTVSLPTTSAVNALSRPVLSNPPVICATQTPYIIDIENQDEPVLSFPAMRNPIHTLISSSTDSIGSSNFLAADNDRYINVFDPSKKGLAMNLVAANDVLSLSLYDGGNSGAEKQVLAVQTSDGSIEFFTRPFLQSDSKKSATSLKAKGRQMTRKADAVIKLIRPDSKKVVPVVKTEFRGSELLVAWAQGGINLVFERVKWQDGDTEELAFSGTTELTSRDPASALSSAAVTEARDVSRAHVEEHQAAVDSGAFARDVEMEDRQPDVDAVSVSGDEDVSDEEEGKEKKEEDQAASDKEVAMKDAPDADEKSEKEEEEEEEGGEPTFGELLQRNVASREIDVEAELDDDERPSRGPRPSKEAASRLPTGVSLSTVLSQALKTNDRELLEACFHTGDTRIIRTTIQRLDSTLAATLLQRVAERMAARPGRYGHLLVWVQWTVVAHGGALAGRRDLLRQIATLFQIMEQRSASLPSLLLLKGKLDMLNAQLTLRQSMADRRHRQRRDDSDEEEEDEDQQEEESYLESVTHYAGQDQHAAQENLPNGISADSDDAGEENDDEEEDEDEENNDNELLDIEAEEADSSLSEDEEEDEEDEDEDGFDDDGIGSDPEIYVQSGSDDEDDEEDISEEEPEMPSKKKIKTGQRSKR